MNAPLLITCAAMGCACGGGAAACIVFLRGDKMLRAQRRNKALGADAETEEGTSSSTAQEWALGYAERLTRRLFVGSTEPIEPSVRAKRADDTRTGKLYLQRRQAAGCAKTITVAAFCEACAAAWRYYPPVPPLQLPHCHRESSILWSAIPGYSTI